MVSAISPAERNALLRRWFTPEELGYLSKRDPNIVEQDLWNTAEIILSRRNEEEAGSARATLQLSHGASQDWPTTERLTYMLTVVLEVLGDDQSRHLFKEELSQILAGRPMHS
jgi:hypothetical protein